jgi:TolB-like protein/Tfp pilus assembly protein PilF
MPSTAEPPTVKETLKPGQSGSAPSLAVLPFTNRSGLPEDEVFAEGMVEDVISALAQGVNVRVLGATTTANLSRTAITDLAALGRQLGVHYLLEGNVRRIGASLRVTTQLLEAETGAVMWTGKFDRPLSELAELQEELVTDIAASLDAQVYSLEVERALKKPSDITAWEAVVRSLSAYRQWDASARVDAIEEARRAVTIAPNYAPAHAALAHALANAYLANPDDPAEVQSIRAIAENALALSPDDAVVLSFVGLALCYVGYPEGGERHTMRAVRKAPGSGMLHFFHGGVCIKLNRQEEALSHLKTAERLGPGSQLMWVVKYWQSLAYRELEGWVEANAALEESLRQLSSFGMSHVGKAICCLQLGEQDAAREHIETARRLNWGSVQAERLWRINRPNSPRLDADIATMRALYAATETAS